MGAFAGPNIVTTSLAMQLDAADPLSYPGSGTAWNDLSGNGNGAALVNSPTFNSGNNGYLNFNGTSQYCTIANGATNMPLNGLDFTTSHWIYLTAYSISYSGIYYGSLFRSDNGGSNSFNIFLTGTASSWSTFTIVANTLTYDVSYAFSLNTWYNVVLSHSSAGAWNFYVNAINVGSTSNAVAWTDRSPYYLFSNAQYPGFQYWLPARVTTVMIYKQVLSATQVAQNFNALRGRYGV